MNVLDLFSGIGGFSLGLERAGMRTIAFCEIDPYCRAVLRKHWPDVPIFEDVRTLRNQDTAWASAGVDVFCGGDPCQPNSKAGKKLGREDNRWLWPEYLRIVEEFRPAWCIRENPIGFDGLVLDEVLAGLEAIGYSTRAFDIPACAVGADHERRRIWIIAHLDRTGLEKRFMQHRIQGKKGCNDDGQNASVGTWWKVRRCLVRGIHGIPGRVDRIRALGNAVVPQIPEIIGRAIMQAEGQRIIA